MADVKPDHILVVLQEAKAVLNAIEWNEGDCVDIPATVELLNTGIEARKSELNRKEHKRRGQKELFS